MDVAESETPPLYLRIRRSLGFKRRKAFTWYQADLRSCRLTKIADEGYRIPDWGSANVLLDSFLYILGGSRAKNSDALANVYYIDTKRPQQGWSKASSMRFPRKNASAIAVDAKIYIFGGGGNLGEVFDPNLNSWDLLPQPPFPEMADILDCSVDTDCRMQLYSKKGMIVIKLRDFSPLLEYYFKERRWTLVPDPEVYLMPPLAVIEDDALYWLGRSQPFRMLSACDLNHQGRMLDMAWSTDLGPDPTIWKYLGLEGWYDLLHLGKGRLCLVLDSHWIDDNSVHILLVQVGRTPDHVEVKVSLHRLQFDVVKVSAVTYLTPTQ